MALKPRLAFITISFLFMLLYVLFTTSVLDQKWPMDISHRQLYLLKMDDNNTEDLYSNKSDLHIKISAQNVTERDILDGITSVGDKQEVNASWEERSSNTKVILYTYMRGGSSFVGELLRLHPMAMYWFEPIDAFYQGLLGMLPSTTPLNILFYQNHTKRNITEQETAAMVRFINNLLDCEYTKNPMTVFGDHHIRRSGIRLSPDTLTIAKVKNCLDNLVNVCHGQNTTPDDLSFRNILHAVNNNCLENILDVFGHHTSYQVKGENYLKFVNYSNCLAKLNKTFQTCCLPTLRTQCHMSAFQALKTIRLPMDMVENILSNMPTLKFIYYTRDPRGIMASRASHVPLLTYDPVTEAKLLCKRMSWDLRIFSMVQKKYPKRTLKVSYEDFATIPYKMLTKLYTFLGQDITPSVRFGLERAIGEANSSLHFKNEVGNEFSATRYNASYTAQAWRKQMDPRLKQAVTDTCSDVLAELNYNI